MQTRSRSTTAVDISDRVLMFDGGKIIEEGPPEKMFTNPEQERTKQFLSAVTEHA